MFFRYYFRLRSGRTLLMTNPVTYGLEVHGAQPDLRNDAAVLAAGKT